jgi:chromosome segregation ATPase
MLSICVMVSSVLPFGRTAYAAGQDVRASEEAQNVESLLQEKMDLEKKFFQTSLDKARLENELLQCKDRLRGFEQSVGSRASKENESLKSDLAALKSDLEGSRKKTLEAVQESSNLRSELSAKEDALARAEEESAKARAELEAVKRERTSLEIDIRKKEVEIANMASEKKRIAAKITDLESELAGVRASAAGSIASVKAPLEAKVESLLQQLKDRDAKFAALQIRAEELEKTLSQRDKHLSVVEGKLKDKEMAIAKNEGDLSAKGDERARLQKEKAVLETQFLEAQREKLEAEKLLASVKMKYEELLNGKTVSGAKEQSAMAVRVQELNAQLLKYEQQIAVLGDQVESLKKEGEEKNARASDLRGEADAARAESLAKDERVAAAEGDKKELALRVDSLTASFNKAVSDLAAKDAEIQRANTQAQAAKEQADAIAAEIARVKAEYLKASDVIADKNREILRVQQDLNTVTAKVSAAQVEIVALKAKPKASEVDATLPLKQKLAAAELSLRDKDAAIKSLSARLDESTKELGGKVSRADRLAKEVEEMSKRLADVESQKAKLVAEATVFESEKKNLQASVDAVAAEKAKLQQELSLIAQDRDAKEKVIKDDGETKVAALEAKIAEYEAAKVDNEKRLADVLAQLGASNEQLKAKETLVAESDKTLAADAQAIDALKADLAKRDEENKGLMQKVISLNEELNTAQKDLSLKRADLSAAKERSFFLEEDRARLLKELESETGARGETAEALAAKNAELEKAKASEQALSGELSKIENELITVKESLSKSVAMAKDPLQTKILETAGDLEIKSTELAQAEKRLLELDAKIEEKSRSVQMLENKLGPYGEAVTQTTGERSSREEEIAALAQEMSALEQRIAGARADCEMQQRELDAVKKEQAMKGLKYDRGNVSADDAVQKQTGRILEPYQTKLDAMVGRLEAGEKGLSASRVEYDAVKAKHAEKVEALRRLDDEQALYGDALAQARKEIETITAQVKAMSDERMALKERLVVLRQNADQAKGTLANLKTEHTQVESALIEQVVAARNLLEQKVQGLSRQKEDLSRRILAFESEREVLQNQLREKDVQIAALNKKGEMYEDQLTTAQKSSDAARDAKLALESKVEGLKQEVERLAGDVKTKEAELADARAQNASLKGDHDRFGEIIQKSTSEREYLTGELFSKSDLVEKLRLQEQGYIAQIEALKAELTTTKTTVGAEVGKVETACGAKIADREAQLKEKTFAAADALRRIDELESQLRLKSQEVSRATMDMNDCGARLAQVKGALDAGNGEADELRTRQAQIEAQLLAVVNEKEVVVLEAARLREENASLKGDVEKKIAEATQSLAKDREMFELEKTQAQERLAALNAEKAKAESDSQGYASRQRELEDVYAAEKFKAEQAEIARGELTKLVDQLKTQLGVATAKAEEERRNVIDVKKKYIELAGREAALDSEVNSLKEAMRAGDGAVVKQELAAKSGELAVLTTKFNAVVAELEETKTKLAGAQGECALALENQKKRLESEMAVYGQRVSECGKKNEITQQQLSGVNTRISQNDAEIARLKESLEVMTADRDQARKELEAVRATFAAKENELRLSADALTKVSAERDAFARQVSELQARVTDLDAAVTEKVAAARQPYDKEIAKLKNDLGQIEAAYAQLKTETPKLSDRLAAKEREALECTKVVGKNDEEKRRLEARIAELEKAVIAERAAVEVKVAAARQASDSEIVRLKQTIAANQSAVDGSAKELTALRRQLEEKANTIGALTSDLAALKKTNDELKGKSAAADARVSAAEARFKEQLASLRVRLEGDVASLKTQVAERDAQVEQLTKHIAGNRQVIESLKKEMGLFSGQDVAYADREKRFAADLEASRKAYADLSGQFEVLKGKNAQLMTLVSDLSGQIDSLKKQTAEKDALISARDGEIEQLKTDREELMKFLKNEIEVRKANLKELSAKTQEINEIKQRQQELIEQMKNVNVDTNGESR